MSNSLGITWDQAIRSWAIAKKDMKIYYLESVYKLQRDVLQYVTPDYGKNQVAGEADGDEDTQ